MENWILQQGDRVRLLGTCEEDNPFTVEIETDQVSEPYTGKVVDLDNVTVTFNNKHIDCVKKFSIKPAGGDGIGFWTFYTGFGYIATSELIANWARMTDIEFFYDMSVEDIIHNHMYWATDSSDYEANYNGSTYVLYKNLTDLPKYMKIDAENNRNTLHK